MLVLLLLVVVMVIITAVEGYERINSRGRLCTAVKILAAGPLLHFCVSLSLLDEDERRMILFTQDRTAEYRI